jgi:hypothetical protein
MKNHRKSPRVSRRSSRQTKSSERQAMASSAARAAAGKSSFEELKVAVGKKDLEALGRLQEHWEDICQYVETLDEEEVDQIEKDLGDNKSILTLWLSTPPTLGSTGRSDSRSPEHTTREMEQEVYVVNALWESWRGRDTMPELRRAFSGLNAEFCDGWLTCAHNWFMHRPSEIEQRTAPLQVRMDILAGYGALVDRLFLRNDQDLMKAISVLGHRVPLVLQCPDGLQVTLDNIGEAIMFRSGIEADDARWLAGAISFSLPAHPNTLLSAFVELEYSSCVLKSHWRNFRG